MTEQHDSNKTTPGTLLLRIIFIILYPSAILGILFLSAGTTDWIEAYIFTGSYFLYFLGFFIWGTIKAPDLLNERINPKQNAKSWDKQLMRLGYTPLLAGLLVLCGLDVGRLKISMVPFFIKLAGGGFALIAGTLIMWVFVTNRFASGIVRIQADRGHTVISSGPYRIVRHPMYLGVIVFIFSIPLILGSYLGLIPAALILILFIIRTRLEDLTLQKELPGYEEYTKKTKKRLIPWIW
ncbi:MAG: isoprenylcysteine carboxylmethyltransferase family protein [Spirochaetales bacterium]|nr:isoprenylcysteine carboxylmethyltransferase family protein [Spirochaetales bacterium]